MDKEADRQMDRTMVLDGERDTENLYCSEAVSGTPQDTKKPTTQIIIV